MKKAFVLALAVLAHLGRRCQRAGQPDRVGPLSGELQLLEDDHAAVRHAADRRCRLPRCRADELGEVRREDARPGPRPEGEARRRRHPRRAGPCAGADACAEVHRHAERPRIARPVDVRRGCSIDEGVLRGEARPYLAVGDADDADEDGRRHVRRARRRSSATSPATTSRARRTRTSWSTACTSRRS